MSECYPYISDDEIETNIENNIDTINHGLISETVKKDYKMTYLAHLVASKKAKTTLEKGNNVSTNIEEIKK
jgi:hypothetical protein